MKSLKIIFFQILVFISINAHAAVFYVSLTGSDTNNGTSVTTPFLTIQKAANVALSGDIVYVRAGVYREMIDIKSNGVTFQNYNGEVVTIKGSDTLLSWSLVPGSGSVYQTNMDWDMDANWGSNQLFFDDKMIELARWPKQTSADIVMPTNAIAENITASGNSFIINDIEFNEPDGRWVGAQIWINLSHHGFDGQGSTWGTITSTNASAHTITIDIGEAPRLGDQPWGLGEGTEYFLFNPTASGVNATGGVAALLGNGEWWKSGNILYVKTPNGLAPSSSGTGSNIIESKKRHFAFYPSVTRSGYSIIGFNLFACSITTDYTPSTNRDQVLEAANNIIIDGINAKYVSHQTDLSGNWQDQHYNWTGIVLRGRNNIIRNCTIQYAATSALSVSGAGNKVLNNIISSTNYMVSNSGAINTGFINQDCEIGYNTIYNTSQMGINLRYSQNSSINVPDKLRIHHNTIYDYLLRAGDSGAIDVFGQDLQWARIDHNIIYKTTPATGNMTSGIYLDFGGGRNLDLSHSTIDHNIIYDVPEPILISNTRYANVYNNVCLSSMANHSPIINANGDLRGVDVKIYNNICSYRPNWDPADGWSTYNLSLADCRNNIVNASGSVLSDLFVDASNHDYHLKSTATAAINAGISVGVYDESPLTDAPDIGAYESTFSGGGSESINIAPTGTGYRWSLNLTSTSNANRIAETGINDNNLNITVQLNTGGADDLGYAFEAGGVIWNNSVDIASVDFIQGDISANGNTCFTANLSVQVTTDGTTWTESGWTVSPNYPYENTASAGITYTFTGNVKTGIKGVRICGQVHTNNNSWVASIKEVRAYTNGSSGSGNKLIGTAYRWSKNTNVNSNSNKVAALGLNDGILTNDVPLNGGANDIANAYEAAGLIFSSATNVNKVEFINGFYGGSYDNGSFDSGFAIQTSTNGTSWSNASGWSVTPAYAYCNTIISGAKFTFTGNATGVKGIRVVGRVHTSATSGSWEARAREFSAYSGMLKAPSFSGVKIENDPLNTTEISIYPNPVKTSIYLRFGEQANYAVASIYNIDGIMLINKTFANSTSGSLNIEMLDNGIYFIKVFNGTTVITKKFIKE